MPENPYLPPEAVESDTPRRSVACVFMFWLSGVLGLTVLSISVFSGYQNTHLSSPGAGRLPPYVVAVTVLVFACGIGLLFSAWLWRSRRVRPAILLFVGSVVAFFVAPWILLMLLAR
jgi:hypothetical protein